MYASNKPKHVRYKVSPYVFQTVTKLDRLVPIKINGITKMRKEHFDGKKPKFIKYMHVIGEAGVVKTKTKTTPETADRGVTCALVGYANDHEGACYQMYNPEINVLYESRVIVWLKRLYFPNALAALDRQIEETDSTKVRESNYILSSYNWKLSTNTLPDFSGVSFFNLTVDGRQCIRKVQSL